MVFGYTALRINHETSGLRIDFTTRAALEEIVGQEASAVLPYADKWKDKGGMETAFGPVKVQEHNYDWTHATPYAGTVLQVVEEGDPIPHPNATDKGEPIPMEMLKRKEPILFFDELVLYESELEDNGTSKLTVKLRVMPSCWFVLMRMYLRVDHVLVRVVDTRMFHAFGSDKVLKERKTLEEKFDVLHKAAAGISMQ